jgi:glucose-6-phosphate isomerase
MAKNVLEWSNAYSGRVTLADSEAYAQRAAAVAKLLNEEVSAGKLPCLNMPFWPELKIELENLKEYFKRFDHMLLLGIGGSALGARALQKAFFPQQDQPGHTGPWLWIADNVDAASLEAWFSKLPPKKTCVVVVSKSGDTIETLSQYILALDWLREGCGSSWNEHVICVTDKVKGFLRQQADSFQLKSLLVPDNLGGRYSVLSAVGLIPATFLGIDGPALVQGALDANAALATGKLDGATLAAHPAFKLASWNAALMGKGYSQIIFFTYIPAWACFGAWFNQLWAESLGKEGKGSMPLPAVGVTDQHSLQQMFLDGPRDKGCLFLTCSSLPAGPDFPAELPEIWSYLQGKQFGDLLQAEGLGTQMALAMTQTPLVELRIGKADAYSAGRLMGLLMATTLTTGWLLGINPVDQPAVELGKRLAKAKLGAEGYAKESADLAAFVSKAGAGQEF